MFSTAYNVSLYFYVQKMSPLPIQRIKKKKKETQIITTIELITITTIEYTRIFCWLWTSLFNEM